MFIFLKPIFIYPSVFRCALKAVAGRSNVCVVVGFSKMPKHSNV